MRRVLSVFIAVCLVLSLFTGAFTPVPSVRALSEGDFTYSLVGTVPNQTATITGYTGPGGVIVLPSMLGGYPVTAIGANAFRSTQGYLLTDVTIPNGVTSIGNYAFYESTALSSVTIPNSVTALGEAVFYYCSALTSVAIPNSVTSIGTNAFQGCIALTSLTIGSGLTSIERAVFSGCTKLTSVTIPNSVTSVGDHAFQECRALAGVVIPNGVTSIGSYAFQECVALTSVTIPNGVTTISERAFDSCAKLIAAYFLGNASTMGANVFASCAPGFTVWHIDGTTGWTNPWYTYPTAAFSAALVLSTSWNLISVSVSLPVSSIPGLQAVYGYHDTWSVPTTLLPGEAYWVQVENAVTVPLPGTPSTSLVSPMYQAGWQLLGNPFDVPLPVSSITNHGYITTCYSYDSAWDVLNPATDSFQPGKGYWVQLSAATTLTLMYP